MKNRKMFRRALCALCMAAIGFSSAALAADRPGGVTVSAGDIDRQNSVVTFATDPALAGTALQLVPDDGSASLPLQVRPDGRASFVLPQLKAGQSRTYKVAEADKGRAARPAASASLKDGAIDVRVGGKEVTVYRGEKTPLPEGYEPQLARGGYLHPVVTPAGTTVTDDYPPNHKHHHGVWAPWTKAEFEGRKPDFWNMAAKTGTVEFVDFGQTWSGPVAGGFTAKHRFVDLTAKPEPKAALNETWQLDAYAAGPGGQAPAAFLFDLQSTQTTASDSPLKLPKYHYGGLGVRGHRQWDGATNSEFLTSEGKTRKDGNGTPARWMVNYGKVDGKPAYIAVLCSPENFRAPQPVRLHPKEPFMCYVPQAAGEMAIEPGRPYVMKYRFVVGDGEPKAAELDTLWQDYANPVKVEVK